MNPLLPLSGTVVLDLTRMLPGAVLTRMLVDLGARVIKVEDPGMGDPMRSAPPLVDGIGAGFGAFMRGVESVCLDLRTPEGAGALRALTKQADVLTESFRPGTLARWDLGPDRLSALNGGLVTCSLSGFGAHGPLAPRVAHDLNLVAVSGLLSRLGGAMPGIQIADVTTGMLACSAILAALLQRHRTHRGMHLDQPLVMGPVPFLTWAWADQAAGADESLLGTVIAGDAACYGLYDCSDGVAIAVGTIEPKFWATLMTEMALPELAGEGLTVGDAGQAVRARVAARFAEAPSAHWLGIAEAHNLPVTAVNSLEAGMVDRAYRLSTPAAYLPSFPPQDPAPAPALGRDTRRVLTEFGLGEAQLEALAQ